MIDSPSGRVPEKASSGIAEEQRLAVVERFSLLSPWYIGNIWEFIALELGQEGLRGAHKPGGCFWSSPEASWVSSGLEKINPKFFFLVWTLFYNDFLKRQKQAENSNRHWALG